MAVKLTSCYFTNKQFVIKNDNLKIVTKKPLLPKLNTIPRN